MSSSRVLSLLSSAPRSTASPSPSSPSAASPTPASLSPGPSHSAPLALGVVRSSTTNSYASSSHLLDTGDDLHTASMASLHQVVLAGEEFFKYSRRRGYAQPRFVRCTTDGLLLWGASMPWLPDAEELDGTAKSAAYGRPVDVAAGRRRAAKRKKKVLRSSLRLRDVISVLKGKATETFGKRGASSAPADLCFSVVTEARSLDLQARSVGIRDLWVEALASAVLFAKRGLPLDGPAPDPELGVPSEEIPAGDAELLPPLSEEDVALADFIERGGRLIKFGLRRGKHARWVCVHEGAILWGSARDGAAKLHKLSRKHREKRNFKPLKNSIRLVQVRAIKRGKAASKVLQRKIASSARDDCVFSVVATTRTLDLLAQSADERDHWVAALEFAVRHAKLIAERRWMAKQRHLSRTFRRTYTTSDLLSEANAPAKPKAVTPQHVMRRSRSQSLIPLQRSMTWNSKMALAAASDDINLAGSDAAPEPEPDAQLSREAKEMEAVKAELRSEAAQTKLTVQQLRMLTFLDRGSDLVKYGRRGRPKAKWINVSKGRLFWAPASKGRSNPDRVPAKGGPVAMHQAPGGSYSGSTTVGDTSYIWMVEVTGVLPGKISQIFSQKAARHVPADVCFSIITEHRTIALQALTVSLRDQWVEALNFAVQRTRHEVERQALARERLTSRRYHALDPRARALLRTPLVRSGSFSLGRPIAQGRPQASVSPPLPAKRKPKPQLKRSASVMSPSSVMSRHNTWSARDHEAMQATKYVFDWILGKSKQGPQDTPEELGPGPLRSRTWRQGDGALVDEERAPDAAPEAVGSLGDDGVRVVIPTRRPKVRKALAGVFDELQQNGADAEEQPSTPRRRGDSLEYSSDSDRPPTPRFVPVEDEDTEQEDQVNKLGMPNGQNNGGPHRYSPNGMRIGERTESEADFTDTATEGNDDEDDDEAKHSEVDVEEFGDDEEDLTEAEYDHEAAIAALDVPTVKTPEVELPPPPPDVELPPPPLGAGLPPPPPEGNPEIPSPPPPPPQEDPDSPPPPPPQGEVTASEDEASESEDEESTARREQEELELAIAEAEAEAEAQVAIALAKAKAREDEARRLLEARRRRQREAASAAATAKAEAEYWETYDDDEDDLEGDSSSDMDTHDGTEGAGAGGEWDTGDYTSDDDDDNETLDEDVYEAEGGEEDEEETFDDELEDEVSDLQNDRTVSMDPDEAVYDDLSAIEEEPTTYEETETELDTVTEVDTSDEERLRETYEDEYYGGGDSENGDAQDEEEYYDEDDYEEEEEAPVTPRKPKRLTQAQVRSILSDLHDAQRLLENTDADWQERAKGMEKLEKLVRKHDLAKLPNWWKKEARTLGRCITAQLQDLRSSVVRAACVLLIGMSEVLGEHDQFMDFFAELLPTLLSKLYVTIRVIRQSADDCVRAVITLAYYYAPILIPVLIETGRGDSHAVVRARAADYLAQILIQCSDDTTVDDYILELAGLIGQNINDSDNDARMASRMLFLAFERLWPQAASKLFEKFSSATQRSVKSNRKHFKATRRKLLKAMES